MYLVNYDCLSLGKGAGLNLLVEWAVRWTWIPGQARLDLFQRLLRWSMHACASFPRETLGEPMQENCRKPWEKPKPATDGWACRFVAFFVIYLALLEFVSVRLALLDSCLSSPYSDILFSWLVFLVHSCTCLSIPDYIILFLLLLVSFVSVLYSLFITYTLYLGIGNVKLSHCGLICHHRPKNNHIIITWRSVYP